MYKQIFNIIWLILISPIICVAVEVNVKALDKATWINIETTNFNVLSNAKENNVVELVKELEDFNYFLALSLGYKQENLSEKVAVIAAKNEGTFTSLGIPNNYGGIFVKGNGYAIFARCDEFRASSKGGSNWGRTIILHELVHLFLHNSSSSVLALPPWYDEGIAEYFSTYIESRGRIIIGDMSILGSRFYSMYKANGKIGKIDTESLFKMTKEVLDIMSTKKINEEFVNRFYARSAAVVHYMYADSNRSIQLYQYLYLLGKGFSVDESFNHVFKMTYSELDKQVEKYISGSYLSGIIFRIGQDGLEFPEVKHKKNNITKQEALGFLYTKLTMLPNEFLDLRNLNKLNDDIENLYPGLIYSLRNQ